MTPDELHAYKQNLSSKISQFLKKEIDDSSLTDDELEEVLLYMADTFRFEV